MEKTAQDLLCEAAQYVEAALAQLNTSAKNCGECGLKHYIKLSDARVHEQLNGLPEKLRRAAERLNGDT